MDILAIILVTICVVLNVTSAIKAETHDAREGWINACIWSICVLIIDIVACIK